MKAMSLFSGVGACALAVERHFDAETAGFCELDPYARRVLRRHWPDVPIFENVCEVGAHNLPAFDLLEAGFPCTDLSVAGQQAGLDGDKSGLYREVLRIAAECKPSLVFVENVPALLHYRGRLESDFGALGYGLTWAKVAAQHVAGCPHRRQRVFVLATLGGPHRGVCDAGALPAVGVGAWPTPAASQHNNNESAAVFEARRVKLKERGINGNGAGVPLPVAVQSWPTPAAKDPGISPSRLVDKDGNRPDHWQQRLYDKDTGRQAQKGLSQVALPAQAWTTPRSRDYKDAGHDAGMSLDPLPCEVCAPQGAPANRERDRSRRTGLRDARRLSPDWVSCLQGLPPGWTMTEGGDIRWHAEMLMDMPRWPAPMVRGMWGDSPQHQWEPPRTVIGKSRDRSARLRCLGNLNPPQLYLAALVLLERGPAQVSIFDVLGAS